MSYVLKKELLRKTTGVWNAYQNGFSGNYRPFAQSSGSVFGSTVTQTGGKLFRFMTRTKENTVSLFDRIHQSLLVINVSRINSSKI